MRKLIVIAVLGYVWKRLVANKSDLPLRPSDLPEGGFKRQP